METQLQKGKIGIHTENILPIIKKWLYSEKEIFIRELISNAFDAIEKLKRISLLEDIYQSEQLDFFIEIKIDKDKGTLHFIDNGIGMTKEEVEKYIAQIAFSGAQEFAQKYLKDQSSVDIIGHFGLGFYSSFMVADKVEIQTRSYKPEEEAVVWISDGTEEYEIGKGTRNDRGTEIILYLNDEAKNEFLDRIKIQNLIRKYCDFISIPVKLDGLQVNYQKPLWLKKPNEVSKEDYISFYKYLYPFDEEPLFYIHLNTDYPFKLQGILYFPKLKHEMDLNQSYVKIFCKQIFVTDEAQEIIPKFLTALKGVLDLPELPLNVSRSYIQQDPEVKKISSHIVKKIADKLNEECKNNRENYEKIWKDISPFVKYGMMEDPKFYENAKDSLLFETIVSIDNLQERKFRTIQEYLEKNGSKTDKKIYYTTDLKTQGPAIQLLLKQQIEVIYMDKLIDAHFSSFLEVQEQKFHFVRVDSEISEHAIEKENVILDNSQKSIKDRVEDIFRKALNNTKIIVRAENLKTEEIPAMILLPETYRRVSELAVLYGEKDKFTIPDNHTLLLNLKNNLIQNLGKPDIITMDSEINPKKLEIAKQIYYLARLSQAMVSPEEMQEFAKEIFKFIEKHI